MKPLISKRPIGSILNPAFEYKTAAQTDVAATFRRIRRQMAEQDKLPQNVRAMRKAK